MKKVFITSLIFLLVLPFATLKAQGDKKIKPFRVALHAAPSISWMKPDIKEYESSGARMGFSYGAIADVHITNNYYFSTGVDITYTGGKIQYPDSIEAGYNNSYHKDSREFKLQYLHIPLMIKMKTKQIGWWTYFANIGLGTSIRLKADADDVVLDNNNEELEKSDIDIKDDIALFRESLIIGGGVQYAVADDISAIVSINFNNGFTDIMTGKNSKKDNENSIVNFLELKVGVLF